MSAYNKYLFHTDFIGETITPEGEGTYADPIWAEIPKSHYHIPAPIMAATTGPYITQEPTGFLSSEYLRPKATVYGTTLMADNPSAVFTNAMNLGLSGHNYLTGSTTASYLNADHDPYIRVRSYIEEAQYGINPENNLNGLGKFKSSSLYGAVLDHQNWETAGVFSFDTSMKPSAIHAYAGGSPCIKLVDTPGISIDDYLGYGGQIGRRTKELFDLHDQLSLLNEEAIWLNSKVTDEFYQSLYGPYGEDFLSYIRSWTEQVKVKIQKVEAKFDRLRKYIIKLKISAGTMRRINKKRVFRTKVNLVFKNLDDAHPSELNYFNLAINVIHQTFKYHTSWKLTFNN